MKKQKKEALTGITRQRLKTLILIMTLILCPLLTLSQNLNINQANETVTLSKEKTIDVAKVIQNETRLKKLNSEYLETIRKQDSIIQDLASKNIQALKTIQEQNSSIFKLGERITSITETQLSYEEKKSKNSNRLFLKLRTDYYPNLKEAVPGVGLNYFMKKFGLGVNFGQWDKNIFYGGEVLISIF